MHGVDVQRLPGLRLGSPRVRARGAGRRCAGRGSAGFCRAFDLARDLYLAIDVAAQLIFVATGQFVLRGFGS